MKAQSIPLYAADGTSLGFRSLEAARRLIANEVVNPVYGRKGLPVALGLLYLHVARRCGQNDCDNGNPGLITLQG